MPITREEKLLNTLATGVASGVSPITREEQYLSYIAGETVTKPDAPITRKEAFLDKIPQGGGGGGGVTIRNQNKTITENGTYTADSGYTGLGTVTVDVQALFATGTYTAADNTLASSVRIQHNLGVVPKRFCWFIVAPITEAYKVSGQKPVAVAYTDENVSAVATSGWPGSSDLSYSVNDVKISASGWHATDIDIRLSNSISVSSGYIAAGATVRWFAWG